MRRKDEEAKTKHPMHHLSWLVIPITRMSQDRIFEHGSSQQLSSWPVLPIYCTTISPPIKDDTSHTIHGMVQANFLEDLVLAKVNFFDRVES